MGGADVSTGALVDEYLRRIGADRPERLDIDSLNALQRRHLQSVPFENLNAHMGRPIDLTEGAVLDKIVQQRRGGICYELNAAFAVLLRELGYDVTLLGGRVLRRTGGFGPPLDHLALRVALDEPWLVDVGFGRFKHPPAEARHGCSPGRLRRTVPGARRGGRRRRGAPRRGPRLPAGRPPQRPRRVRGYGLVPLDVSALAFTRGPTCSLVTPGGRITLAGRRLIETSGTERTERDLEDDQEVLSAYRTHFGIDLDRVPAHSPQGARSSPVYSCAVTDPARRTRPEERNAP